MTESFKPKFDNNLDQILFDAAKFSTKEDFEFYNENILDIDENDKLKLIISYTELFNYPNLKQAYENIVEDIEIDIYEFECLELLAKYFFEACVFPEADDFWINFIDFEKLGNYLQCDYRKIIIDDRTFFYSCR